MAFLSGFNAVFFPGVKGSKFWKRISYSDKERKFTINFIEGLQGNTKEYFPGKLFGKNRVVIRISRPANFNDYVFKATREQNSSLKGLFQNFNIHFF